MTSILKRSDISEIVNERQFRSVSFKYISCSSFSHCILKYNTRLYSIHHARPIFILPNCKRFIANSLFTIEGIMHYRCAGTGDAIASAAPNFDSISLHQNNACSQGLWIAKTLSRLTNLLLFR